MNDLYTLVSGHMPSLAVSIAAVVLIFAVRSLALRAVLARLQDSDHVYRVRKLSFYFSAGLLLIVLAWVWTQQLANLGSFLGLLSAGIAIALSDVLKNIAGWLLIVFRRPFKIGDRIQIGSDAGDVVDIGAFHFSLAEIQNWVDADQTTGRVLHIPNRMMFAEPLANYTEGTPYIWHEIPVTVTFESDWVLVCDLVREIIERHAPEPAEVVKTRPKEHISNQYLDLSGDAGTDVFVSAIEYGVTVTGRLLVEAKTRRLVTSAIWKDLLHAIDATPHADLAYPTTRFFRADIEGSSGASVAGHDTKS